MTRWPSTARDVGLTHADGARERSGQEHDRDQEHEQPDVRVAAVGWEEALVEDDLRQQRVDDAEPGGEQDRSAQESEPAPVVAEEGRDAAQQAARRCVALGFGAMRPVWLREARSPLARGRAPRRSRAACPRRARRPRRRRSRAPARAGSRRRSPRRRSGRRSTHASASCAIVRPGPSATGRSRCDGLEHAVVRRSRSMNAPIVARVARGVPAAARSPGRYLPVSTPCASGDQTICEIPFAAQSGKTSLSGARQSIEYCGWLETNSSDGRRASSAASDLLRRPLAEAEVARLARAARPRCSASIVSSSGVSSS